MTDKKFSTNLYSHNNDGVYCFREAFENASGKWDIRDVDEATVEGRKVIPVETAGFITARDQTHETARFLLEHFEAVRSRSLAKVLDIESLRQDGCHHYRFM